MRFAVNSQIEPLQQGQETTIQRLTLESLVEASNSRSHILRNLTVESVWGLLEHCPLLQLEPGTSLLEKHKQGGAMYIVLEGKLKAYLREQREQEIAVFTAGHTVGELSVIDGSLASAHVVADSKCAVLKINEETFWRLIEASHEFSTNMMMLMAARLRSNNHSLAEQNRLQQKYQRDAMADGLTGLYNRRWLDKKLRSLVARAHRDHHPLSIMMLDVDHFKRFNDEHGHRAGDCVLRAVAQTFADNVRPLDLSARYGGEEFCILLPYTNVAGAKIAAERVRTTVSNTEVNDDDGTALPVVTVSIGIAGLQPGEDETELVSRADAALYAAKQNGRNRVET